MVLPYLKSMLPYCCAALPAAVAWRVFAVRSLRRRGLRTNALHEAGALLLALFAVGLCQAALLPQIEFGPGGILLDMGDPAQNRINLIPLRIFYDTYIEVTKFHNYSYLVVSFLGNVGIFIPLGLLPPLLWERAAGWRKCAGIGFLTSLFIELCQLPLNRCSDVDDLLLNTLGALTGFWLFVLLRRCAPRFVRRFRICTESSPLRGTSAGTGTGAGAGAGAGVGAGAGAGAGMPAESGGGPEGSEPCHME